MKPGDLVTPVGGVAYMYDTIQPHLGISVSEVGKDRFGVVIDSGYTPHDIPYVQVLNIEGKIGWVGCKWVKVISETW